MFGKNLEILIHNRKANKTAFCKYLEISRTTLQDYLNETTYMTSDKIVKTAVYFGVTVASLFGEEDDNYALIKEMIVNQQKQINEISAQFKDIIEQQGNNKPNNKPNNI